VRRRLALGFLVTLCALAAMPTAAQSAGGGGEVRCYIEPDRDIHEQQTIRLVVEAEGQSSAKIAVSGLGGLKNLQVIGGPERRFSSLWSNGRLSATSVLAYTLIAKGPGPAEVPALTVELDGRTVTTTPLRFSVAAAPAGPRRGGTPSRESAPADRADVFVQARLGAREVWVGQAVSLSLLLYSGERISSPSLVDGPALSSFWVENVEVDPEAEASRAVVEGRTYTVYPWERRVLVPQTAGEVEIEPFVMQLQVPVRTGDPFESLFGFGRAHTIVRQSEPLKLTVRPLPTAGRPADFGGAVGRFALRVSLDRDETAVNEAVALTAVVEGDGFLRAVGPPQLETPPDLKVFDPKVSTSARATRGGISSRKTWEWILVPLVAGEVRLPVLRFPYFDPERGTFDVASAELPLLTVRQGGVPVDSAVARADIQLQRRDLAFIKPLRGALSQRAPRVHDRPLFVAALVAPLVWAPLLVLLGRQRARLQQDRGLARRRRARARARQRLRTAAKHLASADGASFHEEVARALVEYVADRFDRAAAGLTYQLADELLAAHGIDATLRRRFRSCLETCDFARYVPSASANPRRSEVLAEASELIDRLEKAW
jgi:hypothetical protein